MFERFTKPARDAVTEATHIARDRGAASVEAEHVLLAVAGGATPVADVLRDAGLDQAGLDAALTAETVRSLAAVGVSADVLHFSPFVKDPRLGSSTKLLLERTLKVAVARGDRHIGQTHLVLAALRAPVGTVPRALECAGVDRGELSAAVERVAGGGPTPP